MMAQVVAVILMLLAVAQTPAPPQPSVASKPPGVTFATAGGQAARTLLHVYYAGDGEWNACDGFGCPSGNVDWGYDSLTYALALRAQEANDQSLLPVLNALSSSARTYPAACVRSSPCPFWSDTPEWDAIALADEYQATHDPNALTKAELAFAYVANSQVFALGACPSIPYQQPGGGRTHLKTLETGANAVKAALLIYRATQDPAYLSFAVAGYNEARTYFLDPRVPLYTDYVFDDGQRCTRLPHRFYASVNGDMIWSGVELYRDTGRASYLTQASATATAVQHDLADARGVFADLQAENDVVEPLVEGMNALAASGYPLARQWLLTNAAAALSERAPDGSYGRFFDGPPPATTVTAWQTNGGLALEIVAAALAPNRVIAATHRWANEKFVQHQVTTLPATLTFHGSAIAVLGTLGERRGERGHARVLVDGHETTDQSGIWQNKSSSLVSIPDTILFAWSWPRAGTHRLTFLPGVENAKEGGSFLRLVGYDALRRG